MQNFNELVRMYVYVLSLPPTPLPFLSPVPRLGYMKQLGLRLSAL